MPESRFCASCGAELPGGAPEQPCPACLMRLGLESWAAAARDQADTPTRISHAPFDAPAVEEIAGRFPQLEVIELIGKGGMGAVYKARQRTLDRVVALKIINPARDDDPAFAERFTREARALAKLNHPHIVTVHDFGQADGLYFLVMEYVDGTNLRTLIRDRRMSPQEALAIVPPLCDALQYAHDEGVVHRDIKPENILVDQKGRVKIADFGLAKLLGLGPADVTLTAAHQAMGTLHYMAPEQLERPQTVDHRADIYSLGVTFYEMLTGELPLGRFAPPSRKVQVDVRLDEIVLRALERDPEQRYQHASDVKTDMSRIAVGHVPPAPVEREWRQPAPAILQLVRNPAIGLWVTGIISWVTIPLAFMLPWSDELDPGTAGTVNLVLSFGIAPLVVGSLMILGGLRMQQLEGYRLAVTASVLPMIVLILKLGGLLFETLAINPADLIGAPMGLWALAVLTRSDVQSAFRGSRAAVRPQPLAHAAALEQVRTPATWLFVASILNWLATPLILALAYPAIRKHVTGQGGPGADSDFLWLLLIPLLAGVIMFAALKMKRLQSYWLAVAGSVLAMLVTPGNLLGLPIGIWSLVVLSDGEVRSAFRSRRSDPGKLAEWWRTCPQGVRWTVHGVLAAIYLISLMMVFSFSGGGGGDEHSFLLGQPEPWFRVEQSELAFTWFVRPGWLLLAAAPGLAALWADRRLTQMEQRPADSWLWHGLIWSGFLAIPTTVGMFSAVLHAQKLAEDGARSGPGGYQSAIILGMVGLLGSCVAIYCGVRLIRQSLHDAQARGWDWRNLTKGQRRVLQGVLLVAGLLLANICFTFRGGLDMSATAEGGKVDVEYHEYGQFDPWYRSERRVGGSGGSYTREFNLLSGSAFAGFLALLAFYGVIRLGVRPAGQESAAGHQHSVSEFEAASADSLQVLPQGAGPAMLALALGYVSSALVMCVGAGMIAYGMLWSTTGWAGLVGGGVGMLFGGAGGVFGVWNHARQYRGDSSIMQAAHWTRFDSVTLGLGVLGLAILLAAAIWWSTSSFEERLLLCLLGALASLQGFGTVHWRWSIRRSQRPRSAGEIDPRMYVLAGLMVVSALCMAVGAAMAIIAVWKIPFGSAGFWGWMGGACGCFFGGGGGLLGTWNSYRQLEGHADMMADPGRNLLDRCVIAVLCIGLALLVAAVSVSPWAADDLVAGGLLLGGLLSFQGLLFVVIRKLIRRGAQAGAPVEAVQAD